jgi:hypothetical protein
MLCPKCLLSSLCCLVVSLPGLCMLSLHSKHNSYAVYAYQCAFGKLLRDMLMASLREVHAAVLRMSITL